MVNTEHMIDIADLASSGIEYASELTGLSKDAIAFTKHQKWCRKIVDVKLDRGWGYILAVFYVRIDPVDRNFPSELWIIVGDLPPAYIDTADNPNGACAIDAYVMEMDTWIGNVIQGKPVSDCIPVNVPPTKQNATMLMNRIAIIRDEILAKIKDEMAECPGQLDMRHSHSGATHSEGK